MNVKRYNSTTYTIYYNNEIILNNVIMTEIPYRIVNHYMHLNQGILNFEEFKSKFEDVKKIISAKGPTQFLLEDFKISSKGATSNTRPTNYYNKKRPLLNYVYNGDIIKFGVWTQWKDDNENSKFKRFIAVVDTLGYTVLKTLNAKTMKGDKHMSRISYENLKNIISNIITDQNINVEDLGVSENAFNELECFDMALIKKISGSNTDSKGTTKSNQSSILLTGEQTGIFPTLRSSRFDDQQVGKSLIIKLDLKIMSNNFNYLNDTLNPSNQNQVINSYITTNETKEHTRVELGCKSLDGEDYVSFYENLPINGMLLVLKITGKLEYIFMAIKEDDIKDYLEDNAVDDIITFFKKNPVSRAALDNRTFITDENLTYNHIGINKIFYGSPGTGKSKFVNDMYYNEYSMRVTFHPEYSYNDFVGYLKPVTENNTIKYSFEAGPFTKILSQALNDPLHMYTLIIEEINRANSASVFGDLFQLLDRDSLGQSEYTVAHSDISKYIRSNSISENPTFNNYESIFIPSNLNIIATMNTADQNVFIMDTAFKRRWEFEYIKILFDESHPFKNNKIKNLNVSWQEFVTKTNEFMMSEEQEDLMISEDKQIGPYFVKSIELNSSSKFAYKVLLYLWDDVFKMDKHRIFNSNIRTFSQLVEIFNTDDAINVFKEDFMKILTKNLTVNSVGDSDE